MKSSVEALEGNKVKLYVEIEEDEFETDINKAFKAIAKEVRLPGFRKGKAPRKVLEARIGVEAAREQALRDAVPSYLAQAVREHDVDLVAQPEVEITDGQESGPVEFDATCEVRPVVTVPGYGGLRVELSSLDVDDAAVDEARTAELERHAGLVKVDRPAQAGDTITIDIATTRDGEEVPGLNVEDWTYEVGQGWIADTFDDEVTGASAGDVLEFETPLKGTDEPAEFKVSITDVQEKELPELTDEWVAENLPDFETIDEWSESLREQLGEQALQQARSMIANGVSEALVELVDIDAPESMVDADVNRRLQALMQQFQSQGIDIGQWMQATGQGLDDMRESFKDDAANSVKADLALRAVAEAEQLDAEPDDLEAEYAQMAMQTGRKSKEIRKLYEDNDAVPGLVAEIRKSKAMDWLVHHVEFVDADGNSIDRDTLLGHTHDDDGNHVDPNDADAGAEAETDDPNTDNPTTDQTEND